MLENVKHTRRSFLRLSALATLGLVAAACGATPTPTKAPEPTKAAAAPTQPAAATKAPAATQVPAAPKPIELRFMVYALPAGAQMVEFSRRYEKKYPNITVKNEEVSWGDMEKKTELLMVGGQLPDMLWGQGDLLAYYAYKGAYRPLDSLVAAEKYNIDEFFPWLIEGHCKFEGKLYALPTQPNTGWGSCIFVNTDMLKAKGVKIPDDSWTITEFREIANKVTDRAKGIFGLDLSWSRETIQSFIGFFGGKFGRGGPHQGLSKEFTFTTDPKTVEGLKAFLDMRLKEHVMPLANELVEGGGLKMWVAGKLAMTSGSPHLQGIPEMVGGKFEWIPLLGPLGPGGIRGSANNTVNFQIGATTKYPEECWGLMKDLASVECAVWYTTTTLKQPGGQVASWLDPRVTSLPLSGPYFKRIGEWFAKGPIDMRVAPWNLRRLEFVDMLHQDGQALDQGIKTWDEQAPVMQKKGDEIFAKPRP